MIYCNINLRRNLPSLCALLRPSRLLFRWQSKLRSFKQSNCLKHSIKSQKHNKQVKQGNINHNHMHSVCITSLPQKPVFVLDMPSLGQLDLPSYLRFAENPQDPKVSTFMSLYKVQALFCSSALHTRTGR